MRNLSLLAVDKQKGFTLIEIMVAMAILALVGVGALSLLNTATTKTNAMKVSGDRLNNVMRAFLFISNDMQQLTLRQVRDEYGDKIPSMKSDLQASTPYIRLTRLGRRNPALLPRSNLEHLIYTVEDKVLNRTSYAYTDGMAENQGVKRPILEDVEDMKISFYDGEQWYDYWPLSDDPEQEESKLLPIAVKMKLELTDYGVIERLYSVSDRPSAQDEEEQQGPGRGPGPGPGPGKEDDRGRGDDRERR
ncbi:type II secretion system minor pseudopilin GspJ [Aliikangiella sp. IMCC44359]|uniref:type II secretion system minor pseudopilin GspJ n=1 Tax=Aliikangiella sp. IMCC44359 TaxID=3459125 RepID=UPI00403B0995